MLQHPHILRMYEIVETREHIYIVTEYVEGGELFDHITRVGRLPEHEARNLFQQMIAGELVEGMWVGLCGFVCVCYAWGAWLLNTLPPPHRY